MSFNLDRDKQSQRLIYLNKFHNGKNHYILMIQH